MAGALNTARFGRRALLLGLFGTGVCRGFGRIPLGGRLVLKVPWPVRAIDVHAADDGAAALFGAALADPLYALDRHGQAYPVLAQGLPEPRAGSVRVVLRPGLVSARGRMLSARDAQWSFERAQVGAAGAFLAGLRAPRLDPNDPLALLFPDVDAPSLLKALASPLVPVVPRGTTPERPDGTGAFLAQPSAGRLLLTRNLKAARGASYLDRVEVHRAEDLADALRAFEVGDADVGWLGAGLHRPRPETTPFDAGRFGWAVLLTGREVGSWGAPGIAQQVVASIDPTRLTHLGLRPVTSGTGSVWQGPPVNLLAADDSPHLLQVARELAALLSRAAHEITPTPTSRAELRARKQSGAFGMMLDFVRAPGDGNERAPLALLSALGPEFSRKPPRLRSNDPTELARSLPLGIVGELRIHGAAVRHVQELATWDFGAMWRPQVRL